MEPFDEKELSSLLQRWKAPAAPASLNVSTVGLRPSRWQWLWTGSIRVPVPVGMIVVFVAAVFWIAFGGSHPQPGAPPVAVPNNAATPVVEPPVLAPPEVAVSRQPASPALAGFRPVSQLEPKIIKEQR